MFLVSMPGRRNVSSFHPRTKKCLQFPSQYEEIFLVSIQGRKNVSSFHPRKKKSFQFPFQEEEMFLVSIPGRTNVSSFYSRKNKCFQFPSQEEQRFLVSFPGRRKSVSSFHPMKMNILCPQSSVASHLLMMLMEIGESSIKQGRETGFSSKDPARGKFSKDN